MVIYSAEFFWTIKQVFEFFLLKFLESCFFNFHFDSLFIFFSKNKAPNTHTHTHNNKHVYSNGNRWRLPVKGTRVTVVLLYFEWNMVAEKQIQILQKQPMNARNVKSLFKSIARWARWNQQTLIILYVIIACKMFFKLPNKIPWDLGFCKVCLFFFILICLFFFILFF